MPTSNAHTKTERLLELQLLFWRNPHRGLRTAKIAEALGISERTARNYLNELSATGRLPVYREGWEWYLAEGASFDLLPVHLSLEEGAALCMAARLLARHSDEPNPAVRSALLKLVAALPPDLVPYLQQLALTLPSAPDPTFAGVFRTLVYGWATRRAVRLTYHPLRSRRAYDCSLYPYLLEPSAIGYTVYVIGHSIPPNALRTYKLERVLRAELTEETFDLPPDFDGLELLKRAWGVMAGEEKLVTVRLRFGPRVARRVKETVWHPSQEMVDLPDGRVEWTALIGDTLEIVPWVRGWGADVEVLEPEELRERIVAGVRKMAALYRVGEIPSPPLYQLLWAKTDREKSCAHPLICHMMDVAQVALALWERVLTEGIRTQFASALGVCQEEAGRLIAFWAGLHDLGKASPCFQGKYQPAQTILAAAGLPFPQTFAREECHHGAISSAVLSLALQEETGLPDHSSRDVALAVGGHHGAWPTPLQVQRCGRKASHLGGEKWDAVRRDLVRALASALRPPHVDRLGKSQGEKNAILTLVSGLTSVADWIGSMEDYFPYVDAPVSLDHYVERSRERAARALSELRWTRWQPPDAEVPFNDLFPFLPNPMQRRVAELSQQLDRPALVIIEAPTGSGKTEAALYLADHWASALRQRGLYVAMPTMATSNQMFLRVDATLKRRYPEQGVTPLLVHSQARWTGDLPPEVRMDEEQGNEAIATMRWFLPRKRSLLAPFGVGTVDQALLSVLQTHHFFVRLFGLSHKTVIFDEIHAYDTYMSEIFRRLLSWLRAVGASVVLLSATLPAATRRALVRAYAGAEVDLPPATYPALTWAMEGQTGVIPLDATEERTLSLQWLNREPKTIARALGQALRDGGCAAVICNTVVRAQEIYRALQAAQVIPRDNLILFHARYPLGWRDALEKKVVAWFGKEGQRPEKAIVVATQVIEQSLDVDFDYLITDLAPVDLLLQRAGRLHRHTRPARPAPVSQPRLAVAVSIGDDGIPDLGRDVHVYEPYVLLRSFLVLWGRQCLTLPRETTELIEAVYGQEAVSLDSEATPALQKALRESLERLQRHEDGDAFEARKRLIATPEDDRLLTQGFEALEEDSPELHAAFQALTRLGPRQIPLVCLHAIGDGWNTEPDGRGWPVDLSREPDATLTCHLARATVSVSHHAVVQHFLAQEVPEAWRKHPLLSDHRVARFVNGICTLPGTPYRLRLSRELGLEVEEAE